MCCDNTANTLKVLHQEIENEKRCSHADLCVVYICVVPIRLIRRLDEGRRASSRVSPPSSANVTCQCNVHQSNILYLLSLYANLILTTITSFFYTQSDKIAIATLVISNTLEYGILCQASCIAMRWQGKRTLKPKHTKYWQSLK